MPVFILDLIRVWQPRLSGPSTSKAQSRFLPVISTDTNHQHGFPSLDQKRFISWWMPLPETRWDRSYLQSVYGTLQMCEASRRHCSARTKYHLSHKLETRHLLKIRSCALLRRPCGMGGGAHLASSQTVSCVSSLRTCLDCINIMNCEYNTLRNA